MAQNAGGVERKTILVPEWTGIACTGGASGNASLDACPLRLRLIPAEASTPSHLQLVSRWSTRAKQLRCRLSDVELGGVFALVDSAIDAYEKLLAGLIYYFSLYFGERGVNEGMREIETALKGCWDWNTLAFNQPTLANIDALRKIYSLLKERLAHTLWPLPTMFQYVERTWPSERGMVLQYLLLANRVRGKLVTLGGRASFEVVEEVEVVLVKLPLAEEAAALRNAFKGRGTQRILVVVSSFIAPWGHTLVVVECREKKTETL